MVDIHTTFLHLGSESWKRVEAERIVMQRPGKN